MTIDKDAAAQAAGEEKLAPQVTEEAADEQGDDGEEAVEAGETDEDGGQEGEASGEGEPETDEDGKPSKSKLRRDKHKARITALEDIARQDRARADAAEARFKTLSDEIGPEPKLQDYPEERDYIIAKSAWESDRRAVAREKKAAETANTQARTNAGQSRENVFRARAMELADRYPDIEAKVFQDQSAPINQVMAEVLMESDRGPEVAYYLATHREEGERIKRMPPLVAARELGRIEARLDTPKPRTVTQAPPPVPTVKGNGSRVVKDPARMSQAEFNRWSDQQEAQYRKAKGA